MADSAVPGAAIPPGAQRFLSPVVSWQLTCAAPRRGLLLDAQQWLRSLLRLVSTYLPAHLVQQKTRRRVAGQVAGRRRVVQTLMRVSGMARNWPWPGRHAGHHALVAQREATVRQIEALVPFLAPELVDRIVAGAARRRVESEYQMRRACRTHLSRSSQRQGQGR